MTAGADVVIGGDRLPLEVFATMLVAVGRIYPDARVGNGPGGMWAITLGDRAPYDDEDDEE